LFSSSRIDVSVRDHLFYKATRLGEEAPALQRPFEAGMFEIEKRRPLV
jgi:hypothetical protein